MPHPFSDLLGIRVTDKRPGFSALAIALNGDHLNPNNVVHGAVMFALADTGMGVALYPTLAPGELCATIEIKINYFKAVRDGELRCETEVLNRGKTIANLQSKVLQGNTLVALANGNYAIFTPSKINA